MHAPAQLKAKEMLAQGVQLTEEQARLLIENEPEVALFLLLELTHRIQQLNDLPSEESSPSTPSGMVPIYKKPTVNGRQKTPGRKKGHPGVRRQTPLKIDQRVEHRLEVCPDCGGSLRPCTSQHSTRSRIIEDIPETIEPVVTEHVLHREYCPTCKKLVEPKVPDALPGATIGNRLLVLTAFWHYGLGIPIARIVELVNVHLHFQLSEGGLTQMWFRLADALDVWYEELFEEVKHSAVLHGDETGWRMNGKPWWLWGFAATYTTIYLMLPSRGCAAILEFFKEALDGILVCDFYSVYENLMCRRRQYCLAHLLREFEKVSRTNTSAEWCVFCKKAKRVFRDALRLYHREDYSPEKYASRIERLEMRLIQLMLRESSDPDVKRLCKRLRNYWDELLTFLDHPEVPPTNNHIERELRPAVVMRKISGGNRSDRGARTQAILMSLFRTLKKRNRNPIDSIVEALQHYNMNKNLPPFPKPLQTAK